MEPGRNENHSILCVRPSRKTQYYHVRYKHGGRHSVKANVGNKGKLMSGRNNRLLEDNSFLVPKECRQRGRFRKAVVDIVSPMKVRD